MNKITTAFTSSAVSIALTILACLYFQPPKQHTEGSFAPPKMNPTLHRGWAVKSHGWVPVYSSTPFILRGTTWYGTVEGAGEFGVQTLFVPDAEGVDCLLDWKKEEYK